MQAETPPVQVARLDPPLDDMMLAHDFGRGSFLADPSTPGYSDGEWKSMGAMRHGIPGPPLFSPGSAFTSPDPRPVTPKTDSFGHSDAVSRHLLVETALLDSSKFDILNIDEVDSLKKEKQKVDARIDSARRKLALESKVRDAAQSLHRLYVNKGRPKSQRRQSLLGGSASERRGSNSSNSSDSASQAGDELASSSKTIDEIVHILIGLENRRQYIESRLLRHTAAVLQAAHAEREADMSQSLQDSGFDDDDGAMSYDDNMFNSHNHINGLDAARADKGTVIKSSDSQLSDVNMRLQLLNGQLRSLISQAKRGRAASLDSNSPDDIPSAYPEDEEAAIRLNNQLEHMQNSVMTLVQEHKYMKENRENENDLGQATHDLQVLEGRLESANAQLYSLVSASPDAQSMYNPQPPPQVSGHGAVDQINYLDETLLTVEQIMQQAEHTHDAHVKEVEELHSKSATHIEKTTQFENTTAGLWDILASDDVSENKRDLDSSDSDEEDRNVKPVVREPFSLQGFSTKVQHLFTRVNHLDQQNETLRRQIQQQRDLAGKAEPDQAVMREIEDANTRAQTALRDLEEHKSIVEAHSSRIEELQDQVASLEDEHRDDARITETEIQARDQEHSHHIEQLTATLDQATAAKEAAEKALAEREAEMAALESEVVRLSTELTMARAELDGAYGSRTDRAKDMANNPEFRAQLLRLDELKAQNETVASELEQLKMEKLAQGNEFQELMMHHQDLQARSASLESLHQNAESRTKELSAELVTVRESQAASSKDDTRMRALEKELAEMATDYQALTRETVEVEKERQQIEAIVDSLRMRIEGLEGHLADEKVKWLGVQRQGTPEPGANGQREMTSTMVMRTEFKKMMREARTEGLRMLRAEQEERRKLEALVRSLRRDKGGALSPNIGRSG